MWPLMDVPVSTPILVNNQWTAVRDEKDDTSLFIVVVQNEFMELGVSFQVTTHLMDEAS